MSRAIDMQEWLEREQKKRQDEANKRAYKIILENITHLTEARPTTKETR